MKEVYLDSSHLAYEMPYKIKHWR